MKEIKIKSNENEVDEWIGLKILFLFIYLLSPIDLIPDWIPILGYSDDGIVILILIFTIMSYIIKRLHNIPHNSTITGLLKFLFYSITIGTPIIIIMVIIRLIFK